MAKTKYDMTLTDEEFDFLIRIVAEGTMPEHTVLRARILLLSDLSRNKKMSVPKVAEFVGTSHTTVQKTRCEFGNNGLKAALHLGPRQRRKTKRSDEIIEKVVSLSKQQPPDGKKKWSLTLLCKESVRLGYVDSIDEATMMKIMHEYNPTYRG